MLSDTAGPAGVTAGRPDPDLDRLRRDFPRWRVWRSRRACGPGSWVATRLVDDDVEPTIVADTAEQLSKRLTDPGRRYGRHLSSEQLEAIERELAQ